MIYNTLPCDNASEITREHRCMAVEMEIGFDGDVYDLVLQLGRDKRIAGGFWGGISGICRGRFGSFKRASEKACPWLAGL